MGLPMALLPCDVLLQIFNDLPLPGVPNCDMACLELHHAVTFARSRKGGRLPHIMVPRDCGSLQEAIHCAPYRGVITVMPGCYQERIRLAKRVSIHAAVKKKAPSPRQCSSSGGRHEGGQQQGGGGGLLEEQGSDDAVIIEQGCDAGSDASGCTLEGLTLLCSKKQETVYDGAALAITRGGIAVRNCSIKAGPVSTAVRIVGAQCSNGAS